MSRARRARTPSQDGPGPADSRTAEIAGVNRVNPALQGWRSLSVYDGLILLPHELLDVIRPQG